MVDQIEKDADQTLSRLVGTKQSTARWGEDPRKAGKAPVRMVSDMKINSTQEAKQRFSNYQDKYAEVSPILQADDESEVSEPFK